MIITKKIREDMTHALIAHAFKKPIENLIDEEQAPLKGLFREYYTPQEEKAIALLKSRFPNSFRSINGMNVNVSGQSVTIGETPNANRGVMREYATVSDGPRLDILDKYSMYHIHSSYDQDDDVGVEIMNHITKQAQLNSDIKARRGEVRSLLNDIRTDKCAKNGLKLYRSLSI